MKKLTKKQKEHIKGMLKKLGYALMVIGDVLLVLLIIGVLCVKSCDTKQQDNTPQVQEPKNLYNGNINNVYMDWRDIPRLKYQTNTDYSVYPPLYADISSYRLYQQLSGGYYIYVFDNLPHYTYVKQVMKDDGTNSGRTETENEIYRYRLTDYDTDNVSHHYFFYWGNGENVNNASSYVIQFQEYVSGNYEDLFTLHIDNSYNGLPYIKLSSMAVSNLQYYIDFLQSVFGGHRLAVHTQGSDTASNHPIFTFYQKFVFLFSSGSYRYLSLQHANGTMPIDYDYSILQGLFTGGMAQQVDYLGYGLYTTNVGSLVQGDIYVSLGWGDFYYDNSHYDAIYIHFSVIDTSNVVHIRYPYGVIHGQTLENIVIDVEANYHYFYADKICFYNAFEGSITDFDILVDSTNSFTLNDTYYLSYIYLSGKYASKSYKDVRLNGFLFASKDVYDYFYKSLWTENYLVNIVYSGGSTVVVTGGSTMTGNISDVMTFIDIGFTGLTGLLGYMILPGISLGLLISIPIVLSLLLVIIKLFKR